MSAKIISMPFDEYLQHPAVSRSFLWDGYHKRRPPNTWAHAVGGKPKGTTRTDFGSAVHAAVLEPESFEDVVLCGPKDRRGNKWSVPKELADKTGRILLTESEHKKCCAIRDKLANESAISNLISGTGNAREQTIIWTDEETYLECKIRPDLIVHEKGIIIDLKTAANASEYGFQSSIADYGYHVQEAMYLDGHQALTGQAFDFYFLVIEPEPPYEFCVYHLDSLYTRIGYNIYRSQLYSYKQCAKNNHWPGYPRDVVELEPPIWMQSEILD